MEYLVNRYAATNDLDEFSDDFISKLAHEGWGSLSAREREVVSIACCGCGSKEIAARLRTSPETTKVQTKRIMAKMHLPSMTAVVAYAIRFGGVEPSLRDIYEISDKWQHLA